MSHLRKAVKMSVAAVASKPEVGSSCMRRRAHHHYMFHKRIYGPSQSPVLHALTVRKALRALTMKSTDGRATSSSPMLTRLRCPPLCIANEVQTFVEQHYRNAALISSRCWPDEAHGS